MDLWNFPFEASYWRSEGADSEAWSPCINCNMVRQGPLAEDCRRLLQVGSVIFFFLDGIATVEELGGQKEVKGIPESKRV